MIIHLYHHMGLIDAETKRRMDVARDSWEREYRNGAGLWLAPALTFARDSRRIGDDQPVPFVRDMISQGMSYAKSPDDVIFLTNADVGFTNGIAERLQAISPAHMRRMDFPRIDRPLTQEEIQAGSEFEGGDGFSFTAKWWKQNGKLFPDMLLGRYGWDSAMRNLIRRAGGVEIKNQLWHEVHAAPWRETAYDVLVMPGNRHNRALLLAWIEQYGGSIEDHLHPELTYK